MNFSHLTRVLGVAAAASWALLSAPGPLATAEPLPGVSTPGCSDGGDFGLHNAYIPDGVVDQAATYAAGKLGATLS